MDSSLHDKRPDDRVDFDVDFSRWLTDGDTILTLDQADVDVTTSAATVDATTFTGTVVKVWLIGGVIGETAKVTVEITSVQGRTKEHCFKVRVRERCG